MAKKSVMGKGLDAIFEANSTETKDRISVIRIADIEPNKSQPRKTFDKSALEELSASIAAHGVIQPIVVKSVGDGFYRIIAGERRYRAAKMAALTEIPAIIMELDDKSAAEIALVENIQRQNLNPLEEAAAYRALLENYGMTQEELSARVGKSRSTISNLLRVLDLPDGIAAYVADGRLSTGHAKALLGLRYENDMPECAEKICALNLSVRAAEALVRKINESYDMPEKEPESKVEKSYLNEIERRAFEKIGRKVKIAGKKKCLEIAYTDNDDLEELLKALCGDEFFAF